MEPNIVIFINTINEILTFSRTKAVLEKGESIRLKIRNKVKQDKVIWKSRKTSVARVDQKGKVTAKKAGKAQVTATVKRKKKSCHLQR